MENENNETKYNINTKWDIDYFTEKKFWQDFCLKKLIYIPSICPLCKKETFKVNEKKINKDIINPFYLQCNNKTCKKKEIYEIIHFLNSES